MRVFTRTNRQAQDTRAHTHTQTYTHAQTHTSCVHTRSLSSSSRLRVWASWVIHQTDFSAKPSPSPSGRLLLSLCGELCDDNEHVGSSGISSHCCGDQLTNIRVVRRTCGRCNLLTTVANLERGNVTVQPDRCPIPNQRLLGRSHHLREQYFEVQGQFTQRSSHNVSDTKKPSQIL